MSVWQGRLQALRSSSVVKYGLANLLPRGVALLGAIILTPLAVSRLGVVDYGIWVLATLIPSLISTPDFGITYGVVNEVARTYQRDGHIAAERERLLGLNRLLNWIAAGWLVVGGLGISAYVFSGQGGEQAIRMFAAMLLALIIFTFGISTTLWSRAQLAMERGHEAINWEGAGKVVSFVASLAVLLLVPNLLLLVVVTLLPNVLAAYLNALTFRRTTFGPASTLPAEGLRQIIRRNRVVLRAGQYFLMGQVAYLIGLALDPFLVNAFLSTSDVTYLSVARRPFETLPLIVTLFSTSLWPVFHRLNETGQAAQLARVMGRLMGGTLAVLLILSGTIIALHGPLYAFLGGGQVQPQAVDLMWIAARISGGTLLIVISNYLYAVELVRLQSFLLLGSALVTLSVNLFVLSRANLQAYLAASTVTYLLVGVLPPSLLALRHLRHRLRS
ncbi:lipopolysaccharide biosynthesis protein [Deinococcus hohokamensis]|uniref:Lipopolysaccharide biosynthesis protein n=1 Tax=Deinococcus hohokamensis TaxID=309883 RepID=A0ABV9ID27_9DEIO